MSVPLAHRVDGPADAPAVLLAPSLGTTWELWDELTEVLSASYRVVRFDTRGHGRSPVPRGAYTVADLTADVIALADSLGLGSFGFVGLSLGGAIGQMLALVHPARVRAAVLCCTVPTFGDPAAWRDRAALVRSSGMAPVAEGSRERWFTEEFRAEQPAQVERFIDMLLGIDPVGYAGCCEALARFDAWSALESFSAPVRVVAARHDAVAGVDACRAMARAIPGADLVVVEDASHMASVAQPAAFNAAVAEHLERHL